MLTFSVQHRPCPAAREGQTAPIEIYGAVMFIKNNETCSTECKLKPEVQPLDYGKLTFLEWSKERKKNDLWQKPKLDLQFKQILQIYMGVGSLIWSPYIG